MVNVIRRHPSKVSGFTLVELLVVITIIGILMGLLIPAVQSAREAARRNQCSTQINNLAKATIQEEMAKRQYPGWIQSFGNFTGTIDPSDPNGAAGVQEEKVGTWAVVLLPYLDAQPTYEIWSQDRYPIRHDGAGFTTNAAPNLAIMQCPSSPNLESSLGRNSYISNNGMHPNDGVTAGTGVDFAGSMSRANGVFNAKYGNTQGPPVRADDIKDGLGNTVLFSENLQAQPWHVLRFPGSDSLSLSVAVASRYAQGMVWHYRDPSEYTGKHGESAVPEPVHLINGAGNTDLLGLTMNQNNYANVARPSSAHTGGVNMGFADGATRFVVQTIDYRVYQALMTPRGKSSDVPFSEYVLDAEAL